VTSSPTLPQLPEFEPAPNLIPDAVGTVAERSFFAFVDVRDDPGAYDSVPEWLVATVRFDDGPVSGSMACSLPRDLAQLLFDAFSGRDPASALPPRHELDDLVGEFSNMVCGTWLTRCAGHRAFRLSHPEVLRVREPADDAAGRRQWLSVNDRPLAIDWDVAQDGDSESSAQAGL
jgi:hypothetical protein